MAEWSNAAVLKTVEAQVSGGSNPSLSALKLPYFYGSFFYIMKGFVLRYRACFGSQVYIILEPFTLFIRLLVYVTCYSIISVHCSPVLH